MTYKLLSRQVKKPWGRLDVGDSVSRMPGDDPVGEIWFEPAPGVGPADPPLLVKYLFTSERLSVQVHPDDEQARAAGYPRGKSEAWYILEAEPGATIAMGLIAPSTGDELRKAAQNGSIERLLDWKPVHPGQVWLSPAGTVHAIGAGLVLIEIQQNVDLTYRLFDYDSDRALHLDAGVAASKPVPYVPPSMPITLSPGRTLYVCGDAFAIESWTFGSVDGRISATEVDLVWAMPISGTLEIDKDVYTAGEVVLIDDLVGFRIRQGRVLFAYLGRVRSDELIALDVEN